MIVFKVALALVFLILAFMLIRVARLGRRTANYPHNPNLALPLHRKNANLTWWLAVAAVALTETLIRFQGGYESSLLFVIHLSFALPSFVLLLTLRFFLTGLKNSRWHRRLAYTALIFFSGTLATGTKLLFFS